MVPGGRIAGGSEALPDTRIGVLLLTSSLERGGAERQVVELANHLDPQRFRVHVCSISPEVPLASSLRDADERLIIIPKRRKYDLMLVWRVMRLMRRLRISVVHSFMFDAEMVGRLAGRLARLPAVICSNRCPHLARARMKLAVARLTAGCFDVMIANSWAGAEFEERHQGIARDRLFVVPNGVDTNRFSPGDEPALRRELSLDARTRLVGMLAHFRANKDHTTFIEAAGRVVREHPDVLFLCVGRPDGAGPDTRFGRARDLVNRLGLQSRVLFIGERGDVERVYRMLDVKVLSSVFEGTPNVVLEAMASGLPVVVTDVSDNARIVDDGSEGFVVPPRDPDAMARCIGRLLADDDLRHRAGQQSRHKAVNQYSLVRLAERTAEVYLRVLHSKGSPAGEPMLRTP